MISATCLSGFATLRTRPCQPSAIRREVRECQQCGKRLSRYTEGPLCMACEDREIRETVEREIELAMAEAAASKRIGTDAPTIPLPRDHRGYVNWGRLVSTFMQMPEPVVLLVDSQSCNAMRTGAAKAIKRLDLLGACRASVEEGQCYLVKGGVS